ncbi:hypothetical protein VIGAN_04075200, partial [Vigna angularis var. angularis]
FLRRISLSLSHSYVPPLLVKAHTPFSFLPLPFFDLALQSHKHHTFARSSQTPQCCSNLTDTHQLRLVPVLPGTFEAHTTPHLRHLRVRFKLVFFLQPPTQFSLQPPASSATTHPVLRATNHVVPKVGGLISFYS